MVNGEYSLICSPLSYRLTWVQRCWPRATPDFGSFSVISSFLLQDMPRHPDTRLFEVREAFKRSLLLGFQAHIRAYSAFFSPPAVHRGASRTTRLAWPVALRATDAEPPINTLVRMYVYSCSCFICIVVSNAHLIIPRLLMFSLTHRQTHHQKSSPWSRGHKTDPN